MNQVVDDSILPLCDCGQVMHKEKSTELGFRHICCYNKNCPNHNVIYRMAIRTVPVWKVNDNG